MGRGRILGLGQRFHDLALCVGLHQWPRHDLPGWVQQTTKALHDANLDGSRLESSALRHRLRLFCGYVPKNPDNHDQRNLGFPQVFLLR